MGKGKSITKSILGNILWIMSLLLGIFLIVDSFTDQFKSYDENRITYETYQLIENGMTYEEVKEFVGSEGIDSGYMTFGEDEEGTEFHYYSWRGKEKDKQKTVYTIGFVDNEVTTKSEVDAN